MSTRKLKIIGTLSSNGVYVGSGDIPDGYNVQIDPTGDDTHSLLPAVSTDDNGKVAVVQDGEWTAGVIDVQSGITIDSELSSTSTNPVQNKVVHKAVQDVNNLVGDTSVSDQINAAITNKVDKVAGKSLSTNDYTNTEKTKLAGIETGANKTVVDSALSGTSTNPIQNKIVKSAIDNLSALVGDDSVSDQISTAVANKVDKVSGKSLSTNDYTTAEKNKLAGIATGATKYTHPTGDGNLHVPATGTSSNGKVLKAGSTAGSMSWGSLTKADVGLGDVDNTKDAAKPVSLATQTALNGKADLNHDHDQRYVAKKLISFSAENASLDSLTNTGIYEVNNYKNGPASSSYSGHVYVTESSGDITQIWISIHNDCEMYVRKYGNDNGNYEWSSWVNITGSELGNHLVLGDNNTYSTTGIMAPFLIVGDNCQIDNYLSDSGTKLYSAFVGGTECTASGNYAIGFGTGCTVSGSCAIALGDNCTASSYSQSFGLGTKADSQTMAIGKYNQYKASTKFVIGGGTSDSNRSNLFRVTTSGETLARMAYSTTGADYAEYFEWFDGNPDNESRTGLFVTLDGEKIRLANDIDDYILGVISKNPSVIGDNYEEEWQGKYIKDIFGENITEPQTTKLSDGTEITEDENILSEDYNSEQEYIPRSERKEWAIVGLMGKLVVVDDGTCEVNGYCKPSKNGVATASNNGYRVMARLDDSHIKVLIK